MAKKGALLEQLVALVQETLKDRSDTTIQTNAKVVDDNNINNNITREIDVLVSASIQEIPIQIAFECKDYSKKAVDIQVVDAFVGKCKHLPQVHKKVIVSTSGFTAKATKRAEQEGIMLCSIENIPLDEIFESLQVYRPVLDFQLGETIALSFESYNEPVGVEVFDSCDCYLNIDDSAFDFRIETLKKLADLKTQMELAKKFMEKGKKPFAVVFTFKFNSSVYIKSKDGQKYNVSEAQFPVLINFTLDKGKVVKQQKIVQGGDVYITENRFENNKESFSTVVIESEEKHKIVFKHGETLIEPSIRID